MFILLTVAGMAVSIDFHLRQRRAYRKIQINGGAAAVPR